MTRGISVVRSRRWAVDAGIAVVVFGLILLVQFTRPAELHGHQVGQGTVAGALVLAVGCAALVVRRRWPRVVLGVSVLCALGYLVTGPLHGPALFVVMAAMYTVTLSADRWTALLLGVGAAVVLVTGNVVLAGGFELDQNSLLDIVAIGLAFALGDAIRNRRAYLAEVVARARRAERSREQEAQRRVVEERLRIARDLHDVVAHHIALINVQAGVGEHLLDKDPEQARTALAHIRKASRSALEELSATIGLLRHPDEPRAPTDPTVGLDRLDELITGLAGVGLRVERSLTGPLAALPAAVDLAAYRIVQEALTNVHKHAHTDVARLAVGFDGAEVRIVVDNDGRADAPITNGTGHGMLGMRERATAVGGSLSAGQQPDGGFRVEAVLPVKGGTLSWS